MLARAPRQTNFVGLQSLTFSSFAAPLAMIMYNTPLKSLYEGLGSKKMAALSRYVISAQITPILLHKVTNQQFW